MNSFNLFGKIIQEPERSMTANGINLCKVKIAVNKNNEKDETFDIYEITLFRKLAEENYNVGQYIAVNGKLLSNTIEKDDIVYHNVSLIGNNIDIVNS